MSDITQDYANDFDPEWFITNYIDNSLEKINEKARRLLLYCLDKFSELFETDNIKGHRLLDVGTGPTIHSVISASDHVTEIYLSDYNEGNRRILSDWLAGKRNLDDLSFRYTLGKHNSACSVAEKQAKMRSCVKAVLPIDITKDKPLPIEKDIKEFDIITSKLCLESASHSLEQYKQCVKNTISLLKPGGFVVVAGVLEQSRYHVGKYIFRTQFVSKEDVRSAFTSAGVQVLQFEEQEGGYDPDDDFKAMFVMLGKKTAHELARI